MSFLPRALLWLGLYVALALAPLALAAAADPIDVRRAPDLELAVALGFVAFALISIEFALVSRLRPLAQPFGIDALMLFHRHMGIAALAFVVAHALLVCAGLGTLALLDPFSGTTASRSGALALWSAAALVISSLWRRRLALRYEAWRLAHSALALTIATAMLVHVLAVDAYSGATLVRTVVIAYVALCFALMLRHRVLRPLSLWRRPWELLANREEGGDTRTLVLRPLGHAGIEFEPGQFVWLTTGRTPFGLQQHPITIASSSVLGRERSIELSIKALGDWSRLTVPWMSPGARVWVDGPFGAFTIDRVPAQGFVLIAGGIGISPMRSILFSMRDRGDARPVLLIHAARSRPRAVFVEELQALQRDIDLRVVHVFEEPEPGGEGERGYVTAEILLRHLPANPRLWQFFVCGPAPMLDAIEAALARLSVPPERVQTERFDML
ncbi:MAG TPA: ferredoxin reductase family protein [Planctomycetota bacterium]|nr:ferredoxin reductase family protein [Planctomycetota bacterium]